MLSLFPCSVEHLQTLIDSPGTFPSRFGWKLAEGLLSYPEFPAALIYTIVRLKSGKDHAEWWAHLLIEEDTQEVLGIVGFKGPPDDQGRVELGYSIAPSQTRKGFAQAAARLMTAKAFADPSVQVVCAETLAEQNASTSVLKKTGFRKVGSRVDPADGPVWCWERTRREWEDESL